VRRFRPEISLGLEAVVLKCLVKNPCERYQSVAEFLEDLDRGENPRAKKMTWPQRARLWVGRNRVRLATAAVLLLAAVSIGAASYALAPTPTPSPPETVFVPGPPEPQPDPVEEKAKRLKAINDALCAGKSAVVVGESGKPLWYQEPAEVIQFGDHPLRAGGCYFHTTGVAVLKLLDPPIERYRVKLQIQHYGDANPVPRKDAGPPVLGFFTGYAPASRDGRIEHSFLSVGYSDGSPNPFSDPVVPTSLTVQSCYYTKPPNYAPSPYPVGNPLALKSLTDAGKLPAKWRTLTVDVSPEGLAVYWDPQTDPNGDPTPAARPFANLLAQDIHKHRSLHQMAAKNIALMNGHTITPFQLWSPKLGIGVWAFNADVALKNVVISPQ
jgi:hypothetical protein